MKTPKVTIPAEVQKAQNRFFWKAIEVAFGVSIALTLQVLLVWASDHREWRLAYILLPLTLLNAACAYFNGKDAVKRYHRWQSSLFENR